MDLADRTDVEPDFNNIPKCLTDTWRIDRKPYANDNDYIEGSEELRSWSISSLIALFLHTSEDQRCTIHPDDFDFLYQSEDLRGHLMHPKLSYHSFRELVVRDERKGKFEPRGPAVKPDIDATILHSEIHIRALAFNAEQHRFYPSLVGLSYLLEILAPANEPRWFPPNPDIIEYRRKPVEAALKVLDDSRPSTLSLHVSDTSFAATFARITNNILKGLSYQNTAVAGGMVLTALLHVDPARDQDKRVQDPDLDLYIYGLSPAETEEKVFEIERVWRRNLPVNSPTLVTRNNRTITFISSYPNRRLQVILKTLPNLTAVLLNFDLDICALAWTGTFVEMLPRCARAIETGYSMFTMDLIWGSHLSDRRSTQ